VVLTVQQILIDVLLGLGVLVAAGSVIGLLVARDDLDRLHFAAPASVVAPVLVAIAVVAREALDGRAIKALLVAAFFLVLNPILSQATARAQRAREHGDWRLSEEEQR
jgi:multicomponent Na+:H+ antiporter subunit G